MGLQDGNPTYRVVSRDLGAVTAYAAAVNRGYTGTKEEFETLMASYATVAQQAAESAQSASSFAQGASQAASSANTAMNNARIAESNAQSAASGAQGYAQSAQQSAQSASQSAQSAESAKNTAVDAVDGFAAGAQQALDGVNQAGNNWKSLAQAKALDSEAYAIGTRDGEDVGSSDPAYHNNSKYYAESVSASAQTASDAAQTATTKAGEAAQSASVAAESARTLTIDATLTQAGQAADAKETGDKIGAVDVVVNGVVSKNYTEGKRIAINSGVVSVIDAPDFSVSDMIPITWEWSTSEYNRFYYSDTESDPNATSYMIVFFDSEGQLLNWYAGAANPVYRAVKRPENATHLRFSFKKDFAGKLTNSANPPTQTYWIAAEQQENTGLIQHVGDLSTLDTAEKTNLVGAVNEVNSKLGNCLDDSYLDYSMVNRLDPDACKTGKGIDVNTGLPYDNASYFVTDYMEIREGETLYFFRNDTLAKKSATRIIAYDKDKNVIPSLGTTNSNSIAQSGDMAYIRCMFMYYESDYVRTPQGTGCIAKETADYIPRFGGNPVIDSKYTREIVRVYATDTEAQVINKFIYAFKTGNCDVIFEQAHYSFGEEMAKVNTDYGMRYNEIPVGNNCRYFFNGAVLEGTLDLSQHPATGSEEFYCNLLGCQRRPSSFELHDGVLIATDTRYVFHDESSAMTGSYRHLYQNMEMHYHTNARTEEIRKCLGGGTGISGVVEIIGCKFVTDGVDKAVSFHGNGTSTAVAEFDLNIRNSWFSNGVRAGELSTNQTARLFYVGNSAASAHMTYDRWTTTAFLNEVRV